jgi:hypothetical protein
VSVLFSETTADALRGRYNNTKKDIIRVAMDFFIIFSLLAIQVASFNQDIQTNIHEITSDNLPVK